MLVQNQFLITQQSNPDDYKYPDFIQFTPNQNTIRQDDFMSLISCNIKDLSNTSGQMTVKYGTSQFDIKFNGVQTYQDAINVINNTENILIEFKENLYLNKFTNFKCNNNSGQICTIQCVGNVKHILGIYQEITILIDSTLELSEDNSLRIDYIKLQCEQIDGCLHCYNNTGHVEIETSTLMLLSRSQNFSYNSKNLDVHHLVSYNPPFVFKIVDQDNRPVNLCQIILQVQFYQKEYFDSNFNNDVKFSSVKKHNKKQAFFHINNQQQNFNLSYRPSKISVSDVSGSLPNVLFTRTNSRIIINKSSFMSNTTYEQAVELRDNYKLRKNSSQLQWYGEFIQVLYDLDIFQEYRDKYIDYEFFDILVNYLSNKLNLIAQVSLQTDKLQNKINIQIIPIYNEPLTQGEFDYYILNFTYIDIQFEGDNNIIGKSLQKFNIGNTMQDQLEYDLKLDLTQMYCQGTQYHIFCDQVSSREPIAVIFGDDLMLTPINNQVWVWHDLSLTQNISFTIKNYIETEDNKIVLINSIDLPDIYLQVFFK